MPEQLICPRCGAPNAPSSTSCYYCGWAPSASPNVGSAEGSGGGFGTDAGAGGAAVGGAYGAAGAASADSGQSDFGQSGSGQGGYGQGGYGQGTGDSANGYGAGSYGSAGGTDPGSPSSSGSAAGAPYGSGSYGSGSYGSGAYGSGPGGYGNTAGDDAAAGGYGAAAGGYDGPGGTEIRPNAGGTPPPFGGAIAAGATGGGSGAGRNKVLIMAAAVGGGLVLIALAIVVILRFIHPDNGPVAGPGQSPSGQPKQSASAPASPSKSATTRPTPSATPPPDYGKVAGKVKDGVLKVVATGCGDDGTRVGSAFLVDDDTAVASYASLAGAQTVAVFNGSESIPAQVKSADPEHGVVVLKLDRSTDGHVFALDGTAPKAKDPVGLLGITTSGSHPSLKTTKITAVSKSAKVGHDTVSGLAATGLDADDGWAGGPTLTADGKANGMVLAGPGASTMMIVPGKAIKAAASGKASLPGANCNDPKGPDVTVIGGKPTKAVEAVLQDYFDGINTGNYRKAYEQLGPHSNSGNYDAYVSGWRSAYDYNIAVHSVSGSGDGTRAKISFNSITLPGQGPKGHAEATCARWDMNYTFVSSGGRLLIDRVDATPSLC